MDYMEIANSPLLWLAAGLCVGLVIFQSVLFVRKSLSASKELGINDSQVKSALKSSFTASIGPSLAILAGMVSLLVAMGGPISWFRLSYIGSVAFELMAAGFAADAAGVWVMTLGSFGWVLFTALFTPKLDDFRHYLAGGKKALLPIISSGAMCGAFAYLSLDRVFRFDSQTIAAIVGFISMAAFMAYNKKKDKQWIKEWSFTISMFVGMFVSLIFI
jgi:hypothetical protein